MRVGILTRRYGYNHGSTLQAFAMMKLVESLNHQAVVWNYDETSAHKMWRIRPFIDHLQYKFPTPFWKGKRDYLVHRMTQEKRFKEFEYKYLKLSGKPLKSSYGLESLSREFDRIVIGSDQIWNPFFFDSNYFGGFLPKDQKWKIVPYAPSLGISNPDKIKDKMRMLLKDLSSVSCREIVGANILSSVLHREIPVVLDPTLMIDVSVWNEMADHHKINNLPKEYILTYFLGTNVHQDILNDKKKKTQLPIINIAMFNRPNSIKADIDMIDLGPGEFLYLIKNANYIFTDSYHASIFSWLFNRDFTVFERFKASAENNENSRIFTLLSILGCQDRLHGSPSRKIESKYDSMKELSYNFLKTHIQNDKL